LARILIIEDNPTNMELMAYLLTAFGHQPLSAFDGDSGVRQAREQLPDLILCDVHLPKLDGYGVLAALKADPLLRAIPVLAVTALAMVGDRERLLQAGFDGYVGKPIEPEHFGAELDPFLPPPRVVLLVDDDAFMREVLADFLGQQGYAVLAADGAAEALALMARHAVGVVLCDQCMPLMTGTEFMERARRLQPDSYRILLTALDGAAPIGAALARGDVDRCLAKPWDGAELLASLRAGFLAPAARVRV
jgi:two-component system cell cycle response regulator